MTRSLYLKLLYVADRYRGRGVGKLLMRAVFQTAGKHGCSLVEWTTDPDNVGAQAFYDVLGVRLQSSKIFYRVEETGAASRSLADRIARSAAGAAVIESAVAVGGSAAWRRDARLQPWRQAQRRVIGQIFHACDRLRLQRDLATLGQ